MDLEAQRRAARHVTTFVLLLLAALAASMLPLPWQLGGLGFIAAALVAGTAALRAARRAGTRDQVAPLVVVGLVFTALMGITLGGSLLLWSAQTERQECLAAALTIQAEQRCEAQYQDAVEQRLRELSGQPRD